MAAVELDDYIRYGNIKNSVNFPNAAMPMSGERRICVLHANIPAILSTITAEISALGLNIENMINQSKGANAYTIIDVAGDINADVVDKLKAVEGIIRVRVI
jgi:D-3-phosphoglycerate dehydrogenase